MKYCDNCGKELNDEARFCPKCGRKIDNDKEINYLNEEECFEEDYDNENYYEEDYYEDKKSNKGIIIFIITLIIIVIIGSLGVYFLKTKSESKKVQKSIEIKEINLKDYPKVLIIVEAKNLETEITSDNIAIKEGEYFPKNISVESSGNNDRYLISYESTSNNAGKSLTVDLEYTNKNDDIKSSSSYKAPEIESENSGASNTSLNTYDPNVEIIRNMYESFINQFIRMVNYGNISYINDYVVIGSNLYNDFTVSIESFNKQNITERIEEYTIQDIKKINDDTYEVYVYESYYINYGKEHSSKIKTFNSIYTAQRSGDSFKFTDLRYAD